ncbi:MAG TPA: aldo/keto reductase [Bryobacteraceae bacterium]|nr:aldo/keto reductase [Bryobacteraceae bacterium]
MSISRRRFLETTAAGTLAAQASAATDAMPTRVLGKTGARVSVVAFGSGSRWLAYKDEAKAHEAMTKALDLGVTYIDTAYAYGNGQSETWVGNLLGARRKDVFLATKCSVRPGDDAARQIEGSLKRLKTDRVDLLHIHSLLGPEDLANIEKPGNVLDVIRKLRDQKVTRFIGVTSHTDPAVLRTALERHDFDVTQMALNVARAGMAKGISAYGEQHEHSFESLALPVANQKKMGVIAMKIFAQEKLNGKAPVEKLISYSLSLPVTAAVLGMPKLEYIEENIRVAKAFRPMPADEMRRLSGELAGTEKAGIDRFFSDHVDA